MSALRLACPVSFLLLTACAGGGLGGRAEVLTGKAQIPGLDGHRVQVVGRVVRPILAQVSGQGPTGTALELSDGELVWVSEGTALPPGWERTEGGQVAVECTVWLRGAPGARITLAGPHLTECSAPTPPSR